MERASVALLYLVLSQQFDEALAKSSAKQINFSRNAGSLIVSVRRRPPCCEGVRREGCDL